MCGIVGSFVRESNSKICSGIYSLLLLYSQIRGKDAAGFASVNFSEINVTKSTENAGDLLFSNNRENLIKLVDQCNTSSIMLGHTRAVSMNNLHRDTDITHTQPLYYNETVGVHNGIIRNPEEIVKIVDAEYDSKKEIDSQALIKSFSKAKTIQQLKEILENYEGYIATIFYIKEGDMQGLYIYHDTDRPMHVFQYEGIVYICSTKEIAKAALEKAVEYELLTKEELSKIQIDAVPINSLLKYDIVEDKFIVVAQIVRKFKTYIGKQVQYYNAPKIKLDHVPALNDIYRRFDNTCYTNFIYRIISIRHEKGQPYYTLRKLHPEVYGFQPIAIENEMAKATNILIETNDLYYYTKIERHGHLYIGQILQDKNTKQYCKIQEINRNNKTVILQVLNNGYIATKTLTIKELNKNKNLIPVVFLAKENTESNNVTKPNYCNPEEDFESPIDLSFKNKHEYDIGTPFRNQFDNLFIITNKYFDKENKKKCMYTLRPIVKGVSTLKIEVDSILLNTVYTEIPLDEFISLYIKEKFYLPYRYFPNIKEKEDVEYRKDTKVYYYKNQYMVNGHPLGYKDTFAIDKYNNKYCYAINIATRHILFLSGNLNKIQDVEEFKRLNNLTSNYVDRDKKYILPNNKEIVLNTSYIGFWYVENGKVIHIPYKGTKFFGIDTYEIEYLFIDKGNRLKDSSYYVSSQQSVAYLNPIKFPKQVEYKEYLYKKTLLEKKPTGNKYIFTKQLIKEYENPVDSEEVQITKNDYKKESRKYHFSYKKVDEKILVKVYPDNRYSPSNKILPSIALNNKSLVYTKPISTSISLYTGKYTNVYTPYNYYYISGNLIRIERKDNKSIEKKKSEINFEELLNTNEKLVQAAEFLSLLFPDNTLEFENLQDVSGLNLSEDTKENALSDLLETALVLKQNDAKFAIKPGQEYFVLIWIKHICEELGIKSVKHFLKIYEQGLIKVFTKEMSSYIKSIQYVREKDEDKYNRLKQEMFTQEYIDLKTRLEIFDLGRNISIQINELEKTH